MTGLIALLDEVAAIAKVAASSLDDIAVAAAKAGTKTAGVVIDDAAVTPKYVQGFKPARELPIIWRIAKGSLINKILVLTPVVLLLSYVAPWAIIPLLMLGGSFLCFEGAEKIFHSLFPHADAHVEKAMAVVEDGHLEETKVKGAIKTDFILSAEIMTIALSNLPKDDPMMVQAAALALVGLGVTIAVYGSVAVIVKMDDLGLYLSSTYPTGIMHSLGKGLVLGMPHLLTTLSVVGTAAMLWVGGSIMVHSLHELGIHHPYQDIHDLAHGASHAVSPALEGFVSWAITAFCDGVLGLIYGLLLIPVVTRIIMPLVAMVTGKSAAAHH